MILFLFLRCRLAEPAHRISYASVLAPLALGVFLHTAHSLNPSPVAGPVRLFFSFLFSHHPAARFFWAKKKEKREKERQDGASNDEGGEHKASLHLV